MDEQLGLKPLRWGGHCFLCSKCVQGDQVDGDFWHRALDRIVLPEPVIEYSLTVEVLALGPSVGVPCSKAHMKRFRRARCLDMPVEVGDLLLCPNRGKTGEGIERFLDVRHWYVIEESVPMAIWKNKESSCQKVA